MVSAQVTTSYTYDALGRVVEVDDAAGTRILNETEITYDDAGNRTNFEADAIAPIPSSVRYWLIPVSGGGMVVITE
ncbi:RHS repeat protein [Parasphingopyxis sp. CP4]|nr:RHS repeat protein [Parasphingopyxis sp. CP4]